MGIFEMRVLHFFRKTGVFALVLLFWSVLPVSVEAAPRRDLPAKRVLLLHTDQENFVDSTLRNSRDAIMARLSYFPDFVYFKLDLNHSLNPADWTEIYSAVRPLIQRGEFDMILTRGDDALGFLLDRTGDIPPQTAVVAYGVEKDPGPLRERFANLAILTQESDVLKNVEAGVLLFGKGAQAILVADDSPESQALLENARRKLKGYSDAGIEYLDGSRFHSSAELLAHLKNRPPKTFVVFVSWRGMRNDTYFSRQTFYSDFMHETNMPFFVCNDVMLGRGALGGYLSDSAWHAKALMQLIGEVFEKGSAVDIATRSGRVSAIFDYAEIQRWGLDPGRLPGDVALIRRPAAYGGLDLRLVYGTLGFIGVVVACLTFSLIMFVRLKRSTRRNNAILAAVPATLFACDAQGKFLFKHFSRYTTRLATLLGDALSVDASSAPDSFKGRILSSIREVLERGNEAVADCDLKTEHHSCHFVRLDEELFGTGAVLGVALDTTALEKLRRESNARSEEYRLTLHSIGDAVIVTDGEGRITLMNFTAEQLTGYAFHEVRGRELDDIFKIVNYQTQQPVESLVEKVLTTGQTVELANHTDLINKNGSRYHISDSAAPVRNTDGEIVGAVLVFRDVTQEYQLKEQIRRDYILMNKASGIAKIGYFAGERLSDRLLRNVANEKLWGWRDGNPLSPEEWVFRDDQEAFLTQWNQIRAGKISEMDVEYRSNFEGRMRYFTMHILQDDESPNSSMVHGFVQEITERRERDIAVQNSLRLKESVFDTVFVSFFAKDLTDGGRFMDVNDNFCRYVNFPREKIIGHTALELFPRAIAETMDMEDRSVAQLGESREFIREFFPGTDGKPRYVRTSKNVYTNANGHRIMMGVMLDVSEMFQKQHELEEAMQAAEAASRAKSTFLATMSHEIRTPLNAVIGFSELLKGRDLSQEDREEYVRNINHGGNALLRLINDILDLSKLEADQMAIAPVKCDFSAFLREMHSIFISLAKSKCIDFSIEIPDDLPLMLLDESRLRQVLLNIIGNAIKFTDHGFVRVLVEFTPESAEKGVLEVRVMDSGVGISPEFKEKIFNPFMQDSRIRGVRAYSGTGLGLSIAKRLIGCMGGELSYESELLRGTTFLIRLPSVACEARTAKPVLSEAKNFSGGAFRRALLVDDVGINLKVLGAHPRKFNMECFCASSGAEALEILERETPDIIFSDVWMPEMNGAELAAAIRQIPRFKDIPIVALTADSESRTKFDVSFFTEILLKPLTSEALEAVLNKLS